MKLSCRWSRPPHVLVGALLLGGPVVATAQHLTLGDAVDRADAHAFPVRAARATAGAAEAQSLASLRGVLPSIRLDAGALRTTDPIGAFGNTLRQRVITPTDFDPARLNFPPASTNWTGGVVVEQPLVNADAFAGRLAARRAARSAERTAEWTVLETRRDVVRAYYGATLAALTVATLEAAANAAQAHVRQAELLVTNGLATRSDALLAGVKARELDGQVITAQGEALTARLALATLIGTPSDTAFALPAVLPARDALTMMAEQTLAAAAVVRPDVAASREDVAAADAQRWQARGLLLPRINSFARYDWNSAMRAFGGEKNWTVGVMASWYAFSGATEVAAQRAAGRRLEAARALQAGAEARADLELVRSRVALVAALARLRSADDAVGQGSEAHRIVTRKYAGGLATVAELLDAAATETQTRLARDAAQYDVLVAIAHRLTALGRDPGTLRALDPTIAVSRDGRGDRT